VPAGMMFAGTSADTVIVSIIAVMQATNTAVIFFFMVFLLSSKYRFNEFRGGFDYPEKHS
jgi:hypothetical protein